MKIQLEVGLDHLIYGLSAVRSGVERTDKFRVQTAENPEFGNDMNAPVELSIRMRMGFLHDCWRGMLKREDDFTLDRTVEDNQELFDALCKSRAQHRWYDTGHWKIVCFYAGRMRLTGYQEAEAAQIEEGEAEEVRIRRRAEMELTPAEHPTKNIASIVKKLAHYA